MRNELGIESFLQTKLDQRKDVGNLRSLPANSPKIDFSSNDYLGFAQNPLLKEKISKFPANSIGSTGSRLISGNSQLYEALEKEIANFHSAENGLIFNSGYDANIGLFSCIAERSDTIIYDQLCHASIRDGIRLSNAKSFSFKHNSIDDLRKKINNATGKIFLVVESVYSMDGDVSPLAAILELSNDSNILVIVDEAHGTGIYGENGKGYICELGLEERVFARVHTFGKALGTHGAIILGSDLLRSYLINFARSFIYTTALPTHTLLSIKAAYEILKTTNQIDILKSNIQHFLENLSSAVKSNMIESTSAIQSILISGNDKVKLAAAKLHENDFYVKAIMHPTVPKGEERLRVCIHSFNTKEEISALCNLINKLL